MELYAKLYFVGFRISKFCYAQNESRKCHSSWYVLFSHSLFTDHVDREIMLMHINLLILSGLRAPPPLPPHPSPWRVSNQQIVTNGCCSAVLMIKRPAKKKKLSFILLQWEEDRPLQFILSLKHKASFQKFEINWNGAPPLFFFFCKSSAIWHLGGVVKGGEVQEETCRSAWNIEQSGPLIPFLLLLTVKQIPILWKNGGQLKSWELLTVWR